MDFITNYWWASPLLLILFSITLYWSYFAFRNRSYGKMMLSGLVQIFISPAFAFTIGPIILGVGVTQIYIGMVNKKRVEPMRHE